MVVGGNLPDVDVLYTGWAGTTLDYLLHHRGHTHTVVGALVLSLLLFAGVRLWWRYREVRPSPADVRFLVGLAVLGPFLHLALDFTNSYGVHPFWPLDNHWYYGDAVFIVEPLLWASSAPLLFTLRSRVTRALVALVLVVGVGLSWFSGLVPPAHAAVLTLLTVGLAVVGRRASARTALSCGIAAWLAVTAVFGITGRAADTRIDALLADAFLAERTLDTVLTPSPVDPFCREVLTVSLAGDRYVVRSALHSLLPGWMPADGCAQRRLAATPTAPLVPVARPATDEVVWVGELSIARTVPVTLAQDYCAVSALMQFARVPWAVPRDDGWLVGDLRYDREPELGFAEIEVGPGTDPCLAYRPPWVPPRQDLLEGR
jgi:inner membrane protein